MNPFTRPALIVCALFVTLLARPARVRAAIEVHERVLPNGVRACYLHHAGAKGVSIFTFLPMGLCADDAGRTQWAHLVEHLVIRTTMPDDLTKANAETLGDHMRLDYYGTPADWREGLSHHARWLKGLPFTAESLRDEPGRANAEVDYAARGMFTHKFATAAWNQVYRHGRKHVALKGDLTNARGEDLQRYRDARLFVPDRTMICIIGGEDPGVVLDAVADALGGIEPKAAREGERAVKIEVHPGEHRATWDVDARHLILTWPTVSVADDAPAYAALAAAGRVLWVRCMQDRALSKHLANVMAGHDLNTPESGHFYVSGALPAGADGAEARRLVAAHVKAITDAPTLASSLPDVTTQLLGELEPQDPALLRRQAPPQLSDAMIEGQVALSWAMHAYRLGPSKVAYKAALERLTGEAVAATVARYLDPERQTVVELARE